MKLTLVNLSTTVAAAEFARAAAAIGRQVREHVCPEWGFEAEITAMTEPAGPNGVAIDGAHDAIVYFGNAADDKTTGVDGVLGYHLNNRAGTPYGFIYLDVCRDCGEPWTVTLSHEVIELLGDPGNDQRVDGPMPDAAAGTTPYALELCDAVQGDQYEIDGVAVSNFVGRAYFGQPGGSGKTNYLGAALVPFGLRPNGWLLYGDPGKQQIWQGMAVTASLAAARARHAATAAKRLGRRRASRW